jgi:hypothetical protein
MAYILWETLAWFYTIFLRELKDVTTMDTVETRR